MDISTTLEFSPTPRREFLACLGASIAAAAAVYLACQPQAAALLAWAAALVDRLRLPPSQLDAWLSLVYGFTVLAACVGVKLMRPRPRLAPDLGPYEGKEDHGDEEYEDALADLGGYAFEARMNKATAQEVAAWRAASLGYIAHARKTLAAPLCALAVVACLLFLRPQLDAAALPPGLWGAQAMATLLLVLALPGWLFFYGLFWFTQRQLARADLGRAENWTGQSNPPTPAP